MPFLTNDVDVKAGALLVLPFDGGLGDIFTSSLAIVHESHPLDSELNTAHGYSPTGEVDPEDL